jgi:hypothetical protein
MRQSTHNAAGNAPAAICLLLILMTIGAANTVKAQFLKNIINKATQKATPKPSADSTSSTSTTTQKSGYDSAAVAQMMNNAMNQKSPAMSAADSAAAKNFMSASGGTGMLYQYKVKYDIKTKTKDSTFLDTLSTAVSEAHNSRVDMNMMGMKQTMLSHADDQIHFVVLYTDMKAYKVNTRDTAALRGRAGQMNYQFTKIGTESVGGYSCIHSRMTMTNSTGKTPPITEDLWTSTAVPGYADLKRLETNAQVTAKMMEAMDAAGCGGMVVKATMQTQQFAMDMLLITAERRNFPGSMFSIPAGYSVYTQQMLMNSIMAQKKGGQ